MQRSHRKGRQRKTCDFSGTTVLATDMYASALGVLNWKRNDTNCVESCTLETNCDLDIAYDQCACMEACVSTTDRDLESGWGVVRPHPEHTPQTRTLDTHTTETPQHNCTLEHHNTAH